MRTARRILLALALVAGSLTAPVVTGVQAATGCSAGAGQAAVFEGLGYSGNCVTKGEGSYDTALMGVGDNTIDSFKIGGLDTNGFHVRVLGCQGAGFTGACAQYLSSGDIPVYPDPEDNYRNTISSYRVQPYATTNTFAPTSTPVYYFSDGTAFKTKQCTWGAADKLHSYAGIYPGWTGNAEDWNNNAKAAGYVAVNDTPAMATILVIEQNVSGVVASGWSGAMNGGTPQYVQTWSNLTGSLGHVAWIVDVRTDSSGVTWLHTLETNVNVTGFTRSRWTVETNSNGISWLNIYPRFNATDKQVMSIIHPMG